MKPAAQPTSASMKRRSVMRAVGTLIFCQVAPPSVVLASPGPPPVQAAMKPTRASTRWMLARDSGTASDVGDGCGDWSAADDIGGDCDVRAGDGLAPTDWVMHPPVSRAAHRTKARRPPSPPARALIRHISTQAFERRTPSSRYDPNVDRCRCAGPIGTDYFVHRALRPKVSTKVHARTPRPVERPEVELRRGTLIADPAVDEDERHAPVLCST